MDCSKVLPSDTMIFPGLPGISRYCYKGIDQTVPEVPTPIVKDREQLPVPVDLHRGKHVIHFRDGVIVDAHRCRPCRATIDRAGEKDVPETIARHGRASNRAATATSDKRSTKRVSLVQSASVLPSNVNVTAPGPARGVDGQP